MIDLRPDPRISTLRPGWLADDHEWSAQLQALTYDDVTWLDREWELAGGSPPAADRSWITTTWIRG
jgi:hypothetical protein